MNSAQRTKLERLEQRVGMARSARDPFDQLAALHQVVADARELERELERDIAERGRAAGLSVSVSIAPPELRAAS